MSAFWPFCVNGNGPQSEADIVGVLAYVIEVIPEHLLAQLDLLVEVAADANKGNNDKVIHTKSVKNIVITAYCLNIFKHCLKSIMF